MSRIVVCGLLFLLSVVVSTRTKSSKARTYFLVLVSYGFYLSLSSWFLGLLLFSTLANYLFGLWLRKGVRLRTVLATGLLFNLTLLGLFKYFPLVAPNLPFAFFQNFSHLVLPLGISFWTFQAMSYLLDLYRGEDLDPSLVEFALYMAFFPVVISGPICRMPDMLPQFRSCNNSRWKDIGTGFRRIAIGILMMLLARLLGQGIIAGEGISNGFDHVQHLGGMDVWCLIFGFGLQLFFDFAGYSHIAIGAAKTLGLTLPENFSRPFSSTTPSVFWTRWHMSLSFWIRDYVFLPLAVLRREIWWRYAALVVAMVAFGIWHGATFLFVLWGFYHGMLLVLHRVAQDLQRRFGWNLQASLWTPFSWMATISLVNLGWIFFRAQSLVQAGQMLLAIVTPSSYEFRSLSGSLYALVVVLALGYLIVLVAIDVLNRFETTSGVSRPRTFFLRIAEYRWYWVSPLYCLTLLFLLMLTMTQGGSGTAQLMYRAF